MTLSTFQDDVSIAFFSTEFQPPQASLNLI